MRMSFGLGLPAMNPAQFVRWVRLAEEAGFDDVTTGDNPILLLDQYVSLTLAALNTSRCRLGTTVTNPVSRDPLVTATAIASVQELAPGRVFLGLSTGAVARARRTALEDYIRAVRELWRSSTTMYQGHTLTTAWARTPVPIFIAASGPLGLRQAGRIADGVIVESGLTPEVIAAAQEYIAEGARAAGRRAEEIEVWWYAKGDIAASKDEAIERILGALAGSALHVFHAGMQGRQAPPHLQEKLDTLQREYQIIGHFNTGAGDRNAQLATKLGLRDYLAERFGIVGAARDWVDTVRRLQRCGVKHLFLAGVMPDKERFITAFGREVLPALRE
ncbi:MAG: LLM class flavin-dependent oxidoreductase [Chloroflexi bacterium]|nr:LLM class flavin-dependent oxidoreductase [Chloroflexota bacterium]